MNDDESSNVAARLGLIPGPTYIRNQPMGGATRADMEAMLASAPPGVKVSGFAVVCSCHELNHLVLYSRGLGQLLFFCPTTKELKARIKVAES